ncbi:MAG: hypothetical protein WCO58_02545 [bacterium]
MNNLGTITQIYGAYHEIKIDDLIGVVCGKYGLQEKTNMMQTIIKEFLEGALDVNGFAGELRKTGLPDTQLSAMIKDIDATVFGPFKIALNAIIAEENDVLSYKPPEEPEDIMYNAGIEIEEEPAEEVVQPQSNENEIVANINKREMKTFSNAGISFDELPSQNELTQRMGPAIDTTNKNMSEANLMEAIEHPTKSEPVIFKGIAQTKLNSSFGIPSTKTDQSLPRVENISSRSNDVYREEI